MISPPSVSSVVPCPVPAEASPRPPPATPEAPVDEPLWGDWPEVLLPEALPVDEPDEPLDSLSPEEPELSSAEPDAVPPLEDADDCPELDPDVAVPPPPWVGPQPAGPATMQAAAKDTATRPAFLASVASVIAAGGVKLK
jgi:hypothetical protein